ncbi:fumarylacetoacetate hydrolase family protein [Ruegeria sp. 2205SS24-7]|uniref:fumarylacetoacetate hydrolase family protein n=1 Tax=Ruegeria discodermiae TaxID=3064389 RepID=UPI002740BAD7|nr:fumarylacetoacetate hydrolase family protein [Ruegeria sp. 2205SS24-7]MDP5219677.1 fumarylacetoacetate hydrolase family protein [Ruegeria sp. 2205SS24-7]
MRLANVSVKGRAVCVAILADGSRLDVLRAAQMHGKALDASSMQQLIAGGEAALGALKTLVSSAEEGELKGALVPADAPLLAPIPDPRKNLFCVGRNYAEHIAEGERAQNQKIGVTEHPVFFTKPPTSIVAPEADILIFPSVSQAIDYEVELAVVIGKPGRNIAKADAYDHVYGYTILNDITARDIQRRHGGQYFKGKGLDGSCPLGPLIVTADAVSDPHALSIGITINGEQRQNGTTADMIFDIPTLIASLSEGMTLEPGDVIATGTPSGVGYAMDPPQFLKDGDIVVCEISEIGTLRNTVRAV